MDDDDKKPEDAAAEPARDAAQDEGAKLREMSEDELKQILAAHKTWLETDGEKGREADLSRTDLPGANLFRANLREATLIDANLQGANLRFAHLEGADLAGAKLQEANLRFAHLFRAKLQEANLPFAQLEGADLIDANLQGANLNGANLQGAYLGGAKLQGADLNGANLQGANLTEAKGLTREQLDEACGDDKTTLPDYLGDYKMKPCPEPEQPPSN